MDGSKVLHGMIANLAVQPQETRSINLGYTEDYICKVAGVASLSEHDVYLNVRYLLKRKDGLLSAGSQVSYDQLVLNEAAMPEFDGSA